MKRAFINWSSGKDAAYALFLVQQQKEFSVENLVSLEKDISIQFLTEFLKRS